MAYFKHLSHFLLFERPMCSWYYIQMLHATNFGNRSGQTSRNPHMSRNTVHFQLFGSILSKPLLASVINSSIKKYCSWLVDTPRVVKQNTCAIKTDFELQSESPKKVYNMHQQTNEEADRFFYWNQRKEEKWKKEYMFSVSRSPLFNSAQVQYQTHFRPLQNSFQFSPWLWYVHFANVHIWEILGLKVELGCTLTLSNPKSFN